MNWICGSLLSLMLITAPVFALEPNDHNAIHQIIEHFSEAWNDNEGHGSADHYVEDADFVNIFGMHFTGKEEIETRHVTIHEAFLKGSIFEVVDVKLREAKPDVVIAHVWWKVSHIQDPLFETMQGIFTHVILKNHDKWEITATQNTLMTKP